MILIVITLLSVGLAIIGSYVNKINKPEQLWIPLSIFVASFVLLLIAYFVILFIWSLFYRKKNYKKQSPIVNFVFNITLGLLIKLARAKVIKKGFEKIPQNEMFMFVYNHTSNFDPMIASYELKKYKLIHASKPSNFRIPIAGRFIRRNCYLEINRKNDREALKSIIKGINYLNENRYSVGIAPEGTRNKIDPSKLLDFRNGCFKLATKSKRPIVICYFEDVFKIAHNFPLHKTKVKMEILDVLYYNDYKELNTEEISKKVKEILEKRIEEK